ncbi:MAG: c-type cytochrome [Methyloprofundus sp.]|nr:c-type cytochrome [Methyloprofundus sp.]
MAQENKSSLISHILWMVLTLIISIGISGQIFIGDSFFNLATNQKTFLLILSLGFFLSGILYFYSSLIQLKYFQYIKIPVVVTIAFGCSSLLLLLLQISYFSRTVFCVVILLSMLALFFSCRLKIGLQALLVLPLLLITIGLQSLDKEPHEKFTQFFASTPVPKSNQKIVNTAYLSLKVRYYDNYLQDCTKNVTTCWPRTGGGIEELTDGYLVATGEGNLHYLLIEDSGKMTAKRLKTRVPLNDSDFAQSGESEYGQGVFRVTDILTKMQGQNLTLLASHHYWYKEQDCVVLRVSSLQANVSDFLNDTSNSNWNTEYESKPCMPRSTGKRSPKFHGEESGGKMIWRANNNILMTVGDHHFDGWNSDKIDAQDPSSDYGKTLLINLGKGSSTIFTMGHRNPQGLVQALDGSIWSTEHGPSGGDELNLLVEGANYGWPLVSYGTEYGQKIWPVNPNSDSHQNFVEPIYSWVPSIAVSNLIVLQGELFKRWRGDFLIASFSKSIHRARIRDGRLVTLEPVRLRGRNGRVRDLIEDSKGRVVVYFDTGSIAIVEPVGSPSDSKNGAMPIAMQGEMLFSACLGCHTATEGAEHGIGPDLNQIYNRSIASAADYNYSTGLQKISGKWSEENLDQFLANPQTFAVGNKMQIKGISAQQDRAALIYYMKSLGNN